MDSSTYDRLDGLDSVWRYSHTNSVFHIPVSGHMYLRVHFLIPVWFLLTGVLTVLTCFISTCGLHVHEQVHPNHTKIQSNVNGLVLNQSLLFIAQSNPNKLSSMCRSRIASRQSQAEEWGRGNCISSFPSSASTTEPAYRLSKLRWCQAAMRCI